MIEFRREGKINFILGNLLNMIRSDSVVFFICHVIRWLATLLILSEGVCQISIDDNRVRKNILASLRYNYYIYKPTNNILTMSNKHTEVLKIYEQKLKYFRFSPHTVKIYCHYTGKFLEKVDKYHQHLVSSDFQKYLDEFKFTSVSQQNQVINAIKFLYEKVLNKKYDKVSFERPRKGKHLPRIIDREYLISCINKIQNIKHKAIIMLAYSVGLRVSEVINLRISDIDSARMVITIRQAKGKKDRIVPLSPGVLALLRDYYKQYKPKVYLFNGQDSEQYSATSCNAIVKQYIGKNYHFHLLRHSCFTSLLENGTDLRIIQKVAGHNSSKTTEIYTHVSTALLNKIQLPV